MKIVDIVVAWLIVLLGVMHSVYTAKLFTTLDQRAMWFLSAGLLLMLLGAVNLLRIRYAAVAGGVRAVCIVANVIITGFVVAVGTTLSLKKNPQGALLIGLMALMTIFSIARRPERA